MAERELVDLYELLQVSPSAEPETVRRVYRLLARRWHPDNSRTGDAARFRAIHDAYLILSNDEKRAEYDLAYHEQRRVRPPAEASEPPVSIDFDVEHVLRLTILELLCARRLADANKPGVFILDLVDHIGTSRQNLDFTLWYLQQKQLVQRTDNSRMTITAEGVDYLEANHGFAHRRRLAASNTAA
jgi:curved DNA-binding protein